MTKYLHYLLPPQVQVARLFRRVYLSPLTGPTYPTAELQYLHLIVINQVVLVLVHIMPEDTISLITQELARYARLTWQFY